MKKTNNNGKIKNATKIEHDGLVFKSKLELFVVSIYLSISKKKYGSQISPRQNKAC